MSTTAASGCTVFEFVPDALNEAAGNFCLKLVLPPGDCPRVSIGRARTAETQIVIPHPTISQRHAELEFVPAAAGGSGGEAQLLLHDHSRNGIVVNGGAVGKGASRRLVAGDVIALSRSNLLYTLRVSAPAAPPPPPAPASSVVRVADVHERYEFVEPGEDVEACKRSPDFLGDGGFSVVFKARDRETGNQVAIKRVDVRQTYQTMAGQRAAGAPPGPDPLEVEVALLHRLSYKHIVRLHEVIRPLAAAPPKTAAAGGTGGARWPHPADPPPYLYIVTELVTGGELFYRVADGPTPEVRAKGLFRQLCKAVAYLREWGAAAGAGAGGRSRAARRVRRGGCGVSVRAPPRTSFRLGMRKCGRIT